MATQRAHVSIGIAGTLGPEAAARIAVAAEAAGFSGLWVNEIAGADALGMLAAEQADGALMSWLTPQIAKAQAAEFHEIAPNGRVSLYVRTAVDEAGVPRRDAETVAYAGYPAYKANYARLGMDPFSTILPQPGDDSIAPGGAEYRDSGIDELVLRAMTFGDEIDDYVRFTEQAGEALGLRA